jgi:CheY-like chemotaxis protein
MAITVSATQPEQPAAAAGPVAAPTLMQGRVLLVDDALDNQRLLKVMLQRMGPTVQTADHGKMAIDLVAAAHARGENFDLVLMDLQMPEMDGLTAIRWLRQQGFATPIVALTAHAMEEDRAHALAVGANSYETKPISRQRLQQVLASYLQPAPAAVGVE